MDWISIKDKQPKDGEKVIVWFEPRNGQMSTIFGFWDEENQKFVVPGAYVSEYDVVYWMPEPEKPEGTNYTNKTTDAFIDIENDLDTCDCSQQFVLKIRKDTKDKGKVIWESPNIAIGYPYPPEATSNYNLIERQTLINALALFEELRANHDDPEYGVMKLDAWATEERPIIDQTIGDLAYALENEEISATILSIDGDDWMGFYVNNELVIEGDRDYVYHHMLEKFFDEVGIGKENIKRITKTIDYIEEHGSLYCPAILDPDETES